jgi:hypothetical protein
MNIIGGKLTTYTDILNENIIAIDKNGNFKIGKHITICGDTSITSGLTINNVYYDIKINYIRNQST